MVLKLFLIFCDLFTRTNLMVFSLNYLFDKVYNVNFIIFKVKLNKIPNTNLAYFAWDLDKN